MPFAEDFTAFFSPAEFAVQTTLAGVVVRGIFDNAYQLADVGGAGMASTQPTLTLPSASVPPQVVDWFSYFAEPRVPVDLRLTIHGKNYQIMAHEADGTGISMLRLELVS